MALTSDQLSDLQKDIGITTDQSVFTDAELNRLYTRASDDYDAAVVLAIRQLLMQSARFFNYTVGQTRYERKQVFDNLRSILKDKEAVAGMAGGQLSSGVISLQMDQPDPDTDTTYDDYARDY